MVIALVFVGIVAVVALIIAMVGFFKVADMDAALKKLKKQQEADAESLKQRLESLSKALSARENPFAEKKAPQPEKKKTPAATPAPTSPSPGLPHPMPFSPPPASRQEPVILSEPEPDVNFDCPHCGQNIDAPASMVGFHVNCPTCSGLITIPSSSQSKSGLSTVPTVGASRDTGVDEEQILKGATVRIDINQVFEEIDREKPKRQIVIKRRR